uniref:Kinesin-like protein n=1 Tax=Cyprinus carpio TaxID=7962 RepID=A0A8C1PXP7_CYPCA
ANSNGNSLEIQINESTVALRIRPLSDAELEEGATIIAHKVDDQMVVLMDPMEDPDDILRAHRSREKTYMFDVAFDYSATQDEVYRSTTKGLIEGLISGYNATVFAYGPTGCGKTYTMLGTDREPGIYVRTLNDLFKAIEETSDDMQYSVSMSYLEIYNEMIRDLLNPSSGFLDLREDSKGEIQVAGITEVSTINAREIMELLMKGNKQRTQEPTAANQTSSRSHAVLQVAVRQQSRCRDILQEVRFARLFMIDLAGSERASQTQNRGQRLKEGAHINRSLLALGNCINALSEKNGNKYVNYRDSKLTRLLKDSLGGNSRTVMIAHISPASLAFEDSRNTMTYADRAKSIRTRVKRNLLNVSYHVAQYTSIISDLRSEIQRLKKKIADQASRQLNPDRTDIRHVQAEVQAHSSQQSRAEMDQLREQLIDAFRQQMDIRKRLMELDNSNMEIQIDTSKHLLTITDWEQERFRRRKKWQGERRKESFSKDESEKDSDSPESLPDSTETQEVAIARENLVSLMAEQKKIQKQKAGLEQRLAELREKARRLEELLPRRVSSEEQREVLCLLCKVHELEIENAEMQSSALLKDNVIRQKNVVVQRFEQHRHLCHEIIQQQRQFIDGESFRGIRNGTEISASDKSGQTVAVRFSRSSLPKITLPSRGRDPLQEMDSDQESVRTLGSDNREGRTKLRRHTLPPILPDSFATFLTFPSLCKLNIFPCMETFNGQNILNIRQQILRGVQNIAVKAARQRSKVLEIDALRLPPPPSPLDSKKHKSNLSLTEAPPKGLVLRHGRQPSPELCHATSDDNLSSSTGDGPAPNSTWTRPRNRQAVKNPAPREQDFEGRRRKRRSRSFEVTGQALSQAKNTSQRFRPLDSTSDPHLHINGHPPAPLLRPQHRAQPQLTKVRPSHNIHQTGLISQFDFSYFLMIYSFTHS